MTTLELAGQTAEQAAEPLCCRYCGLPKMNCDCIDDSGFKPMPKNKGGRKPGDPRNTGPKLGLTVPCWWGCGATISHGTLREHWMKCPKRPKQKGKR